MRRAASPSAFTLVEMVLALGVLSFALIALLGLLAVGLQAQNSSTDDTVLAALGKSALTTLRAAPYTLLTSTNYYYARDGRALPTPAGAYYQCAVDLEPSATSPHLTQVNLFFSWPIGAQPGATHAHHKTIATALAHD